MIKFIKNYNFSDLIFYSMSLTFSFIIFNKLVFLYFMFALHKINMKMFIFKIIYQSVMSTTFPMTI